MRNDVFFAPWEIRQTGPAADDFCESVFFCGNGRFGTRGYVPFENELRPVQRGLFMAGIFGEIKPGITDFVNLPTPVFGKLYLGGCEAAISSPVSKGLDLKHGVFTASYSVGSVQVEYSRFMPLDRPSFLVQRIRLHSAESYQLLYGIETACCNCPVPDDQTKDNLETVALAPLTDTAFTGSSLTC
ncbi:MAG: glycoside hydrolase family 65 protein, partial [Oscillospiraceae bacterium]|nr:glycoside hydrolase family 65 protein [Oscillospiraceae bacterium]